MPSLPEIGSSLPEVVLRTAIVYLFVVVALRLSGKREVGQMSVLELVVILVISDAVQNSMVGENTTLWGGLIAVVTLLAMDFALKAVAKRSKTMGQAIEGEPRLLVRDGRLLARAIRRKASRPRRFARRSARTASSGPRMSGSPSSRPTARSASSRGTTRGRDRTDRRATTARPDAGGRHTDPGRAARRFGVWRSVAAARAPSGP